MPQRQRPIHKLVHVDERGEVTVCGSLAGGYTLSWDQTTCPDCLSQRDGSISNER